VRPSSVSGVRPSSSAGVFSFFFLYSKEFNTPFLASSRVFSSEVPRSSRSALHLVRARTAERVSFFLTFVIIVGCFFWS
jgi:hypothetical protein